MRTQEYWINQYQQKSALWMHDGNPKRPHARLTSGKHSNGFFNSRLIIPDEELLLDAASDLLELFVQQGGNLSKVEVVVGLQTGATKLARLLSGQVPQYNNCLCLWASPAKHEPEEGKKLMVFSSEELALLPGKWILLCEDVLTTGGSVDLTANAVTNAGGIVLPFVLVLVNRSGLTKVNGKKIVALIDRAMPMWMPDECPLCKSGSEAIRPKAPEDWARLRAVY
jgi:orotate phosphoribosyltransferase